VTRDEALAILKELGLGVVEDGDAIIVVDRNPKHKLLLSSSPATATRYASAEIAARARTDTERDEHERGD
jgi:hypothetical protein